MGELAHLQHRDPLERHHTGGDAGRGGDRVAGEGEQVPPKGINSQPTKGEVRAARAGSVISTTLLDLRCQVLSFSLSLSLSLFLSLSLSRVRLCVSVCAHAPSHVVSAAWVLHPLRHDPNALRPTHADCSGETARRKAA